MRRLAAAFSRRDKSQPAAPSLPPLDTSVHTAKRQKSGLFVKAAKDQGVLSPVPELIRPGLGTPSSSSSSDGSCSLPTPLDDATDFAPDAPPSKWSSWIPGRRKASSPKDAALPSKDIPSSTLDGPRSRQPKDQVAPESDEDESDGYSSSSSSSVDVSAVARACFSDRALAQTNLRAITQSGLDGTLASHPLLSSLGVTFPRSCNPSSSVSTTTSMHATMHRNRLLRRLDSLNLSPSEEASILPFAKRSGSMRTKHVTRRVDEEAVSDRKRLVGYSRGLRTWLQRPTFEARMVDWKVVSENVVYMQVTGTHLGVAELEFSEGVQALAGLYDVNPAVAPEGPPRRFSPQPAIDKNAVKPARPSATSISRPTAAVKFDVAPAQRPVAATTAQRGRPRTRDEDDIPLGLVVKTRREREERERQALLEQQRRALEEERRAKEEERQQKAYAGQVHAARLRRERYRSGTVTGNPFDVEGKEREQERQQSHSLAQNSNSRRTASEAQKAPVVPSAFVPVAAAREGKSRPPSLHGSMRSRRTERSRSPNSRPPPSASAKASLYASSAAGDSRQSLSDRRSVSESTMRTLPRSFKPAHPPPLPTMPRARSTPQVHMYPVSPVYMVPAMPAIAVPVQVYGAAAMRHPMVDPRMSWSTDRLSMFAPPGPTPTTHIQ